MHSSATPPQVLYIEDDRINIVLMEEVFRLMPGWTLVCAETGAEALACIEAQRPDLILMDMNLPDTDGLSLIAAIQARPQWQGLRCIALSADALPEPMQRAREAGFVDYWTKPIEVHRLQRALQAQPLDTAQD